MRVLGGTTSGLWQSYLHIAPEVKYWFSAKEHHGQERCATLVKEPCTPRGMTGERRGRANGQKKQNKKGNNRSPCKAQGGETEVRVPHLQLRQIYWSQLMSHPGNTSSTKLRKCITANLQKKKNSAQYHNIKWSFSFHNVKLPQCNMKMITW